MISSQDFSLRVDEAENSGAIVELSDGMIDQVVGGIKDGPGDFHDVFRDSHVEAGIGPTFGDVFTDVYPFGD